MPCGWLVRLFSDMLVWSERRCAFPVVKFRLGVVVSLEVPRGKGLAVALLHRRLVGLRLLATELRREQRILLLVCLPGVPD